MENEIEEWRIEYEHWVATSMPWLLGEMLGDSDRLMRTTAVVAFERGWEAAKAKK